MKRATTALLLALSAGLVPVLPGNGQEQDQAPSSVTSTLLETDSGQLVLAQTFVVQAPVSAVWKAYTTEEGWTSWASPKAKIDLRPGGTIRTQYDTSAEVGDPGTITLHVVNSVPERLLTLRAEISDHFPAIMKADDGNLMQVTVFEAIGEDRTRVSAYGVGYRDVPEYRELIKYFEPANVGLYEVLIERLEQKRDR